MILEFTFTSANTAPYYQWDPISQSVSINSVITYTLPPIIDADGDPVTVAAVFPTAEGFVTYDVPTRTLRAAPNSCGQVGGHKVFTILSDGLVFQILSLMITVTNSIPTLISPPQNQIAPMFQVTTYTLPARYDPEGMLVALYTHQSNNSFYLPNFMSVSGFTYTMSPTTADQVGTYTIYAKTFDCNQGANSAYSFTVTVMAGGAYFDLPLVNQQVYTLHSVSYTLPTITDPYGLAVSLTHDGPSAYVTYNSGAFTINPMSAANVGTHTVTIVLNNGILTSQFKFDIIIKLNTLPSLSSTLPAYSMITDAQVDTISTAIVYRTGPSAVSFLTPTIDPRKYNVKALLITQVGNYEFDLILSDGYEQIVKTLEVEIYNLAPEFDSALTPDNIIVHLNSVATVNPLPLRHDPEGMPFTTKFLTLYNITNTWAGLPSCFSFDGLQSQMTVRPIQFALTGIWKIQMILDDYDLQTKYEFQVTIVNTEPYFISAPENKTLQILQELNYTLPLQLDNESHSIQTLLFLGKNNESLPSFMKASPNGDYIIISPSLKSHAGTYMIFVYLTDSQLASKYNFTITINFPSSQLLSLLNIGAPAFVKGIDDIELLGGVEDGTIVLPPITDPDSDSVTTIINIGSALPFVTVSPNKNELYVKPDYGSAGTYTISITLQDGNEYFPKKTVYYVKIKINSIDDPFLVDLKNQTQLELEQKAKECKAAVKRVIYNQRQPNPKIKQLQFKLKSIDLEKGVLIVSFLPKIKELMGQLNEDNTRIYLNRSNGLDERLSWTLDSLDTLQMKITVKFEELETISQSQDLDAIHFVVMENLCYTSPISGVFNYIREKQYARLYIPPHMNSGKNSQNNRQYRRKMVYREK
ncbi:hypothetical protein FGO68_gene5141 [Halteria grandinella]|uniref:Cadherin domain-containing protein n=1 Tax=Halteria grandinella TaxID=5974 RepID=A0A8J8P3F7_HALGN|nr:hypothetical protein FGO68_gene5141 [Halteria grandinella]